MVCSMWCPERGGSPDIDKPGTKGALMASADSEGNSIPQLIREQALRTPEGVAIEAPGRLPLTYRDLWIQVEKQAGALREYGLTGTDRVAMVLPNGPEAAVAFLAAASCAACAPLNPDYRAPELEFFLTDLAAKALILPAGLESAAREVARSLRIPTIELLLTETAGAGTFTMRGEPEQAEAGAILAGPGDVALILHTSGTTSRPKMVPLTHANLCASAENVRASLGLTQADRCLNVMPLFHIHGLVAAVLASLAAGASVGCAPGFYAPRFFEWLDESRATWYTAVPSMHQAILARAKENEGVIARHRLRLIRSSSSALPPQVMGRLEQAFGAPVIEAYGMTEAAHQMASNPLPPRQRKPGSVGVAAGPEIAIMDPTGRLLPAGERGEIVIRGANVTTGYLNNPEANSRSFVHGWFRTGDQGYQDADGYLVLTGRLKEIINRGGEKIAPREIDEALLDHPAVAQAVAFAVADPRLGEEVAAAVVLRPGGETTERELRDFVADRLASFKVPRRILILDEIPKGPTGKLQRIGLGEKLGLTSVEEPMPQDRPEFVAPRTPVEEALARLWSQVLRLEHVGVTDRFLDLGGDSVLAALLLSRVRESLSLEISLLEFFEAPTVAQQAETVERLLLRKLGK